MNISNLKELQTRPNVVNEDTILKVGKFYNVVCARLRKNDVSTYLVPIIGEIHQDKQFSVNYKHIHIDGRFIPNKFELNIIDGFSNYIIACEQTNVNNLLINFEIAKKKCYRLETGISPPNPERNIFVHQRNCYEPKGYIYWKWYKSMIGKSCAGKRCPHLGTKMHERNGKLVCPLHNLEGDIHTEVITTKPEVEIACEK